MKQRVSLATHLNRIVSLPAGELAIVIGVFSVLATTSMHWVVRNISAALPGYIGDPLLNTWILAWDADRLLHGLDGFWDAPMFFPYTSSLAYSEHLLGVAIFTNGRVPDAAWWSDERCSIAKGMFFPLLNNPANGFEEKSIKDKSEENNLKSHKRQGCIEVK